jgi:hypothetical protein
MSHGIFDFPDFFLQDNYVINKQTIAKRLNAVAAFNQPIAFRAKDQL